MREGSRWESGPLPKDLFREVYEEWISYVYAICLRIVGRSEEARDVTQDVFLALYKHRSTLIGPQVLKSWLRTTAVRRARRYLKKRKLLALLPGERDARPIEIASRDASPAQIATLRAALETLETFPIEERVAWSLRYLQGETLPEIAALTGCSLATAKRRIRRAQDRFERGA